MIDVATIPVGAELDAAVAREVLGLTEGAEFGAQPTHAWAMYGEEVDPFAMDDGGNHNGPACTRCGYSYCVHCRDDGGRDGPCVVLPARYSSDIAAAWRVVERLYDHYYWTVGQTPRGSRCKLFNSAVQLVSDAWGETAPEAIARAALLAVRKGRMELVTPL